MPRRQQPDPFAEKFGRRVQTLYKAQGLTLEAFADRCGIAKGHMSNIVRGLSVATVVTMHRIARGLGMPTFMLVVSPEDGPYDKLADRICRTPPKECENFYEKLDGAELEQPRSAKRAVG